MPDTEPRTNSKINFVKRFLFFSAGLERKIVTQEEFIVEHSKYEAIGASVLFTAIMAGISGGYALYMVFLNQTISVLLGLFWGVGIFTIDRLVIIGIIRKSNSKGFLAFLERGVAVAPRIVLAIFIGFVVSEPIKLRLFQSQIEVKAEQIFKDKEAKMIEIEKSRIKNDIERQKIEEEKESERRSKDIKDNLSKDRDELRTWREKLTNEANGAYGQSIGQGLVFDAIDRQVSKFEENILKKETDIKKIEEELVKQKEKIDQDNKNIIDNLEKKQRNLKDPTAKNQFDRRKIFLLDSMVALDKLAEEEPTIRFANMFLTLFFLVIELLPILAKLSIGSGVYEELLELEKETVKLENAQENRAKLRKIEIRLDSEQREQEEAQKLWYQSKMKFLQQEIQLSEMILSTKIRDLAEGSTDKSFIKGLSEKFDEAFDEVYNEVVQMRLPLLKATTTKDATYPELINVMDEAEKLYAQKIEEENYLEASQIANDIHEMYERVAEALKMKQDSDEYSDAIQWSSYWKIRQQTNERRIR